MDKAAQLKAALQAFFKSADIVITTATVVSVQGATCTVKIDDVEVADVRLRATKSDVSTYMLVTPKVNTDVLVASLSGDLRELAVIACDEAASVEFATEKVNVAVNAEKGSVSAKIDSISVELSKDGIIMNGGKLGGLVLSEKMVTWMQKVSSDLATLQNLLSVTPVAGSGAPLAITFTPTTPSPSVSDFENDKVKQ